MVPFSLDLSVCLIMSPLTKSFFIQLFETIQNVKKTLKNHNKEKDKNWGTKLVLTKSE